MVINETSENIIRITNITISEQNTPELFRELNGISQKARGERLRCLATIGLLCVSSPKASLNLSINENINEDNMQNEGFMTIAESTEDNRELEFTKKIMSNF